MLLNSIIVLTTSDKAHALIYVHQYCQNLSTSGTFTMTKLLYSDLTINRPMTSFIHKTWLLLKTKNCVLIIFHALFPFKLTGLLNDIRLLVTIERPNGLFTLKKIFFGPENFFGLELIIAVHGSSQAKKNCLSKENFPEWKQA